MTKSKQFGNLDKIWSTLSSHKKEKIRTAVLLDEKDIALAGGDRDVVRYLDFRLRDLSLAKSDEDEVVNGDLSKTTPDA